MGNNNSSGDSRKSYTITNLSPVARAKLPIKTDVNGSRKKRKSRRRRTGQVSDNFIIHGIDYLPESVKRKERRKKDVPKFLHFDEPLWQSNPLSFFARFQNGHSNNEGGIIKIKKDEHETKSTDVDNNQSLITRSHTACAGFSEEKFMDWRSYKDYPFQNIVMSGGGSKGYAYIGSLKALEDCGILKNVTKVAGCSAGAICAGLLAVGCSPQEIADVFKCDIKWLFHDQTCACCCCLPRVCNKFGIHPAKRFHEIYGNHLRKKVGNPDITFLQLKESRNRELCVVVTNLSRMCSEYFNHRTTPNLPIRDAVRMSMAFPVVFRAIRYTLYGRESVYTDGGLLDQYPIHCFDGHVNREWKLNEEEEEEEDEACDVDEQSGYELPNMTTLGLYVVSEKPMDHKIWLALFNREIPCKPTYLPNTKLARERLEKEMAKRKLHDKMFDKQEFIDDLCSSIGPKEVLDHYEIWNKSHVDINNFGEYFVATLETLLISQRKLRVKTNDNLRTVPINCGYVGTNDYVIEPGDREFMIDQGYTGTVRYLREFIASRNLPTHQTKKKNKNVPRSESSNFMEHSRIWNDSKVFSEMNEKVNPPTGYFSKDGDVSSTENLNDFNELNSRADEISSLEKLSKNSPVDPRMDDVSKDFFQNVQHHSSNVKTNDLIQTETNRLSDRTNYKTNSTSDRTNHKTNSTSDRTNNLKSSDSKRHLFNLPPNALSSSLESEGYDDLVKRTLTALDQSELIPESRV